MKIILIQLGTQSECFVSTSVIKGLRNKFQSPEITCLVENEASRSVFKYNKNIKETVLLSEVNDSFLQREFDLLVNLHPGFSPDSYFEIKARESFGFNFSLESDDFNEMIYGKRKTSKNIFQIYFNVANLVWRGESYDFFYRPKSKCNNNRSGLAIVNANLRYYVIDKLELENSRIWYIPFKHNIFKKLDEINKCQQIITDDMFTMHLSIFLRKNIYFLKTLPYNFKLEFFGKGMIFPIPTNIV